VKEIIPLGSKKSVCFINAARYHHIFKRVDGLDWIVKNLRSFGDAASRKDPAKKY
jgi:hypothetical protein